MKCENDNKRISLNKLSSHKQGQGRVGKDLGAQIFKIGPSQM